MRRGVGVVGVQRRGKAAPRALAPRMVAAARGRVGAGRVERLEQQLPVLVPGRLALHGHLQGLERAGPVGGEGSGGGGSRGRLLLLLLLLQLLGYLGRVHKEAQALMAGREGRGLFGFGAGHEPWGGDPLGEGFRLLQQLFQSNTNGLCCVCVVC